MKDEENGMEQGRQTQPSSFILPPSSLTFHAITLGCKVNQYETEYLREGFCAAGLSAGRAGRAGRSVRGQHLHRHGGRRGQEPQAHPPVRPAQSAGGNHRHGLLRQPGRRGGGRPARRGRSDCRQAAIGRVAGPPRPRRHPQRAFPTSTGGSGPTSRCRTAAPCSCSYCIIPSVRPVLHSRGLDDVLGEVRRLADHGHREIVLVGIHLGHYGLDGGRLRA